VIAETTPEGRPTGKEISPADVADHYGLPVERVTPTDLAWVPSRGWLCTAPSDVEDIVCLDPDTSKVTATIPTGLEPDAFPSGLAYDPERDLFFVMGRAPLGGPKQWHRTLTGPDHADPGREVASCRDMISSDGLAWDPATRSLWTNGAGSLRQVDPTTCTAIAVVQPEPTTRAELFRVSDVDEDGDLLTVFKFSDVVGEFVASDPMPSRLPWLTMSQWQGTVDPRRTQKVEIGVDEAQLPDGLDQAWLVLRGNGGDRTKVIVPIALTD
jgi:hypothetical protein